VPVSHSGRACHRYGGRARIQTACVPLLGEAPPPSGKNRCGRDHGNVSEFGWDRNRPPAVPLRGRPKNPKKYSATCQTLSTRPGRPDGRSLVSGYGRFGTTSGARKWPSPAGPRPGRNPPPWMDANDGHIRCGAWPGCRCRRRQNPITFWRGCRGGANRIQEVFDYFMQTFVRSTWPLQGRGRRNTAAYGGNAQAGQHIFRETSNEYSQIR